MKKPSKEKAIDLILVELEKGSTKVDCVANIGKHWQIAERTFERYWKIANQTHTERKLETERILSEQRIEAEKERLKKAILTKNERMEIASKIAKGEAWKVQSELMIPTANDRLKALDYLSKIDGDYAVQKTDITTNGEKISTDSKTAKDIEDIKNRLRNSKI